MGIRERLKQSKAVVGIYENFAALYYYMLAGKNAIKSRKVLTKEDIEKIRSYKDIHKGERCFIIGTGPSQNAHDLDMLKDEITFTVNTGYKAYAKTQWRADYYVMMDDNGSDILKEVLNGTNRYDGIFCSTLLKNYGSTGEEIRLAENASNVFMFDTVWNKILPKLFPIAKFSDDISQVVYCGKTVVYACIQIAAYMGFSEIYLSGIDCDYSNSLMHSEIMDNGMKEDMRKQLVRSGELMRKQFDALAKLLPQYHVKVYNATRGGALESFPRVVLEDVLKEKG